MIQKTALVNLLLCGALFAQSAAPASTGDKAQSSAAQAAIQAGTTTTPAGKPKGAVVPYRYRSHPVPPRARQYYAVLWGVDSLAVKSAESGEIIKFAYRVLDPEKARELNEKKNEPSLIDPQAGVKLAVPALEKIGKLRQSSQPEVGKVYWMAFSNKGGYVKPGHRVNVVIGKFRADGLVVQ